MKIKICGLTLSEDVERCLALGVDAIGLNLCAASPRRSSVESATELAEQIGSRALVVWVIDACPPTALESLLSRFGASCVQRCDPAWEWPLALALSRRIEVVRLRAPEDVARAASRPEPVLVCDAPGALGGSGKRTDWGLARELAARRGVWLAGGLHADNVAEAVRAVRPVGVDVASGVEVSAGVKDHDKLEAFVRRARG